MKLLLLFLFPILLRADDKMLASGTTHIIAQSGIGFNPALIADSHHYYLNDNDTTIHCVFEPVVTKQGSEWIITFKPKSTTP